MMVLHRGNGSWEHRRFPDLYEYLRPGDLLALNNAEADPVEFEGRLVPHLPPYIKRKGASDFTEEDFRRYRTVYASAPGSQAAPTAGFHFTEEILKKVRDLGVEIRFLTLNISYDTYKPIRCQDIREHQMHGETYVIPEETAAAVLEAKRKGRRVVAVGTTTVRALESWANAEGDGWPEGNFWSPPQAETKVFRRDRTRPILTRLLITPGFQFQIVDALLTNFHRPRSTVLVMTSAFAGRELILTAYEKAIRERYRLFSYGDSMLILE